MSLENSDSSEEISGENKPEIVNEKQTASPEAEAVLVERIRRYMKGEFRDDKNTQQKMAGEINRDPEKSKIYENELIKEGMRLFPGRVDRRPIASVPTGILKHQQEEGYRGTWEDEALWHSINEELKRREAKNKILEFISNIARKSSSVFMFGKVGTESDDRGKKAVKEYYKKRKELNETTPFSEKIKDLNSENLSELEGKVKNADFALGAYDKEFSKMEKDIVTEKERRKEGRQ